MDLPSLKTIRIARLILVGVLLATACTPPGTTEEPVKVQPGTAKPLPRRLTLIPPRPPGALTGSAFLKSTAGLSIADRERRIFSELAKGNIPSFLRMSVPVKIGGRTKQGSIHQGWIFVIPDYLAIGSDSDFVRIPMNPATAQRLADAFGCLLPTRSIVNTVYNNADIRLPPQTMPPALAMRSNAYTETHQKRVEAQLSRLKPDRRALIAGHKKDLVVTNRLIARPTRVAIYGWHTGIGRAIQPLNIWHKKSYADYSHGTRLILGTAIIDGREIPLERLYQDPKLSSLVSDEGPLRLTRLNRDDPKWTADELQAPPRWK